jgi:DNA-binding response OmpR family regulator
MVESVRTKLQRDGSALEVFAAAEEQIVEVGPALLNPCKHPVAAFAATTPVQPALVQPSVLLGIADPELAAALSEVTRAEGVRTLFFTGTEEARKLIAKDRPSLAILEHDIPRIDGIATCRAIRRDEHDGEDQLPVVVVAGREEPGAGRAAGVTDWLIKPIKGSFARTKIRAWVMRTACRWMRAPIPSDEAQRLASLRGTKILDTEPEERFDRITRLAAALFNVPIALVSLVDEDRQWFKSCYGLNTKETSRDVAFCAHVVSDREPMIVSDTFQDERFADNPMVIDDPRIRFYAGCPLILDDGSCIGSLCLIDTRPRFLDEPERARLRDLAALTVRELQEGGTAQPADF